MWVILTLRRRRKGAPIAVSEMLVDSAGVKELCIVAGRYLGCNSGNEECVRSNDVVVEDLDLANPQRDRGVTQGKIAGSPDRERQAIPSNHRALVMSAQFVGGRVLARG